MLYHYIVTNKGEVSLEYFLKKLIVIIMIIIKTIIFIYNIIVSELYLPREC